MRDTVTRRIANRRAVLGALGATITAGLGLGGASAAEEHRAVQDGDPVATEDDAETVETAYTASVERAFTSQRLLLASPRYCSADQERIAEIDRDTGEQVRIRRSDDEYAVYTLADLLEEDDDSIVRMGLRGRRRLGTSSTFDAVVDATVPHPSLSIEEAESENEFVERLEDPGEDDLVVISPHGGAITPGTDDQADTVADSVTNAEPTRWGCKGWAGDEGAFERWFVPSREISPASFPELAEIVDRGFDYCVSFRGLDAENVHVTSTANDEFADAVAAAVEDAVADEYDIARRYVPADSPSEAGDRLVSRLTTGDEDGGDERGTGVWIGQSRDVRSEHGEEIAEAVATELDEAL